MRQPPNLRRRAPRTLLLLAVGAWLMACETVVEVTPPTHTPALVAQAFFTRADGWAVRVSHTVPFDAPRTPGFVDDATVEIWDDAGQVIRPTRSDSGTYTATGAGALEGKRYTLRVTAPGYAPTEGADALPPPPPVAAFTETPIPPPAAVPRRRQTHVEITLVDPADRADRYGLFVVQARWSENRVTGQRMVLPPTLFTFESENPVFKDTALDLLITDLIPYQEAFFTDTRFNGQTYTLDFDVTFDLPSPQSELAIHRQLFVILLSVSEDFYEHWITATQQVFTNENPFAEPLRVHSNMSNGLGVFGGFQYQLFPLGVDSLQVGGYGLGEVCRLLSASLPICAPSSGP